MFPRIPARMHARRPAFNFVGRRWYNMRATVAGSAALLTLLGLLITLLGPPSGPAARRRQQQGGAGTPVFDPVHPDKNPGARNNAGWVGLVKSEMPAEKCGRWLR